MRVLLANSERGYRGGEHQTWLLARGLASRGCEVAIAARRGSVLAGRAEAEDIACRVYSFEKIPLWTPAALARFVAAWRPDVCHAQTAGAHTHLWIARGLTSSRPPLVVSRRVAFAIPRTPFSLLKYRRGVAHFVPISRAAAENLSRAGVSPGKMTIISSGVDTTSFAGGAKGLRGEWGIAADEVVVGVVAAFELEKGLSTLIEAAARMRARGSQPRFVLIGEGSLEPRLAGSAGRLGADRPVLFARQDKPLEEILGTFDIFALPSLAEGLSTALLAAMASGLPVVASDTGGIPEAVSPDCAILVPPGDAGALALALERLVDDEGLRRKMGGAARIRAGRFDISSVVEKTLALYRWIAGAGESERGS